MKKTYNQIIKNFIKIWNIKEDDFRELVYEEKNVIEALKHTAESDDEVDSLNDVVSMIEDNGYTGIHTNEKFIEDVCANF